MSEIALEIRSLEKIYSTFRKDAGFRGALKSFFHRQKVMVPAVKPTSFSIRRGEFVGLLGPNGAGKTTVLKMMTGLIPPTRGGITAFGQYDASTRPKNYLRRIGMVMGQRNQLHPDLPAIDSFKLAQAIYDIEPARFDSRLAESVKLFDIEGKLNIPVRKLSLGERMKMELILAILHEPELLFLDEPTIGLDFNAAKQIRHFLAETNRKFGITIILTSHYIKDIEELCRRVILINEGNIVYDGPLDGLDERVQGERLFTITMKDPTSALKLKTWVDADKNLTAISCSEDASAVLSFATAQHNVAGTIKDIMQHINSAELLDITINERGLEEIFAEIYSKKPAPSGISASD